jgi:hypothetical protein
MHTRKHAGSGSPGNCSERRSYDNSDRNLPAIVAATTSLWGCRADLVTVESGAFQLTDGGKLFISGSK